MNRWTTGQVSKMRNVSVRTLRYYDEIGLLTPSQKEDNGRRYYSEADLFTLEKITLMKSLSLPLEDIQQLIDKLSYRHILTAHYNHLQEQLTSLQSSISNTATLIHMIDIEGNLSWEKVSNLVQNAPENSNQWMDYFGEEESKFLRQTLPNLGNSDPITQQYVSLLRRIEWCIQQSIPPESDEGCKIATELHELSLISFEGDEDLIEKFWEVRKRPANETGLFPISDEVLEFLEKSSAYALGQEKAGVK
ncbi:transcriptional regulator [Paenibacillus sp. KS1]|uniref:MerR family transcriptional regulator n=1 Tax=Paenibacillus sp. KS1 TaxID=1849249 RepID=UPI0008065497|nr:MerR family transcriptional regulator [Paenibacillus sp. KS1]OBY79477.1 transcriptional regulator [Paenibacillus sp. KS1]